MGSLSRRAALALAIAAVLCAAAPGVASARPSLVVQAAAKGVFGGFEQMSVTVECATADVRNTTFGLTRCSLGPVAADVGPCFECFGPPVAVARGTVPLGPPYELCVAASSYGAAGFQSVSKCAPLNPMTFTAVIAG